ncbi:MAG TPA: PilZ domain-containing protein [Nitrospirae bacterium]|nr:PilZ domain-containing protein [Nitrospirota bacterium]
MNDSIKNRSFVKIVDELKSEMARYKKGLVVRELKIGMLHKKMGALRSELMQYKGKKRRFKRVSVGIITEIIVGSKRYTGFMKELSAGGMQIITGPVRAITHFVPGSVVDIKFQLPTGQMLTLHCEVRWLHTVKARSEGLINSMGLAILDVPPRYKAFFKTF